MGERVENRETSCGAISPGERTVAETRVIDMEEVEWLECEYGLQVELAFTDRPDEV